MFGRRNKSSRDSGEAAARGSDVHDDVDTRDARDADGADGAGFGNTEDDEGGADFVDERPGRSSGLRLEGPFDVSELHDPHVGERIDLGGMWLPGIDGVELRMQVSQVDNSVESVGAVVNESAMELRPFAAPRNEGIWDDVRAEIAAEIATQGGASQVMEGPFGPELHTRVGVQLPDGTPGMQPLRFVGVDGPRWFLRAVISGAAAMVDPSTSGASGIDAPLLALLRGTVVLRGGAPMAPRDALELRLPPQAVADAPASAGAVEHTGHDHDVRSADDLHPFERGPEITEIR